ncbi:TPA: 3-deoxy-D-manno-oct-2-ulosonate III transferase WaaZ, partial [Escherichia coli]|nr:3-deoxy-D-manno-oct-2-ulosonate III transferase WaaZ [Escherichia coli]
KKCNIELQLILMLINHPETKVIWYKNAFRNFSQKEKILYKQNKN